MSKPNQNQVWSKMGKALYLTDVAEQVEILDNVVYKIHVDSDGRFYLRKMQENFKFDYKLYGLETPLVERVLRTYTKTEHGNIGVLLNGLKGTGKTVTSKVICNKLKLPVIIVGSELKGCHIFLNSIPQDITVFIDEYEKIFGNSSDMLTIMDGALNSRYRRVFILTTNELRVDENLIQRPSRIRYLKKFEDLQPHIVTEIVDDILEHKQFRNECIKFMSNLEVITVDIVKAVLQEVNIHAESPEAFQSVFNVKKLRGKFNISVKTGDTFASLVDECTCSPRPMFNDGKLGDWFSMDNTYVGKITKILGWNMIEVSPVKGNDSTAKWLKAPMIFKVEDADMVHNTYKYSDEYGGYGGNTTPQQRSVLSELVTAELNEINLDESDEDEDEGNGNTVSSGSMSEASGG